jgi:hypothetical protein
LNLRRLGDQVSVFMSPSDRVAQLYPQAWSSFSSPLRLAGLRWRYCNPASTWGKNKGLISYPGMTHPYKTIYVNSITWRDELNSSLDHYFKFREV